MSDAVLISIRPEWCKLIAEGAKPVEVRPTKPKILTPFKSYIYCTKGGALHFWKGKSYSYVDDHSHNAFDIDLNGKIIGEFVCDNIKYISPASCVVKEEIEEALEGTCLSVARFKEYAGWKRGMPIAECRDMYGWHICDLKIYDEPKRLSDFSRVDYRHLPVQRWAVERPPQSWMYVMEEQG